MKERVIPGIVSLIKREARPILAAKNCDSFGGCYETCDAAPCDCFDSGDCYDVCDTAPSARPKSQPVSVAQQ